MITALIWAVGTALVVLFELRTDDTGMVAGFIVLTTFALGAWRPRHAWRWALLVGPAAPVADLFRGASGAGTLRSTTLVTLAVIAFGLLGAYAGALLRRAIQLGGNAKIRVD